jgi:transcriptional regulator with XRE-family HTH domain
VGHSGCYIYRYESEQFLQVGCQMEKGFFGEWIRKRRNILGLTQEAIAEQAGYSIAMIRKIEDDERRPSRRAAALLAEALEIPEDQQAAFLKVARQERPIDQLGALVEEESFPWQAAASGPKTNLPLPATLFVGREAELARLTHLLQNPACRLVVLIGLAGTGAPAWRCSGSPASWIDLQTVCSSCPSPRLPPLK